MATNKDGQYVYQKGDGFGGFLLDLFTPDAANVKQRNQTVRRVTGSVTGVVDNYVNTAGSVLKPVSAACLRRSLRSLRRCLPSRARLRHSSGGSGGRSSGRWGPPGRLCLLLSLLPLLWLRRAAIPGFGWGWGCWAWGCSPCGGIRNELAN